MGCGQRSDDLSTHQLLEQAAMGHQLAEGSLLHDPAGIQDIDAIGVPNGRKAMRDHNSRRIHSREALRHYILRSVVERALRQVEQEDLRSLHNRARDQEPLPLAPG